MESSNGPFQLREGVIILDEVVFNSKDIKFILGVSLLKEAPIIPKDSRSEDYNCIIKKFIYYFHRAAEYIIDRFQREKRGRRYCPD